MRAGGDPSAGFGRAESRDVHSVVGARRRVGCPPAVVGANAEPSRDRRQPLGQPPLGPARSRTALGGLRFIREGDEKRQFVVRGRPRPRRLARAFGGRGPGPLDLSRGCRQACRGVARRGRGRPPPRARSGRPVAALVALADESNRGPCGFGRGPSGGWPSGWRRSATSSTFTLTTAGGRADGVLCPMRLRGGHRDSRPGRSRPDGSPPVCTPMKWSMSWTSRSYGSVAPRTSRGSDGSSCRRGGRRATPGGARSPAPRPHGATSRLLTKTFRRARLDKATARGILNLAAALTDKAEYSAQAGAAPGPPAAAPRRLLGQLRPGPRPDQPAEHQPLRGGLTVRRRRRRPPPRRGRRPRPARQPQPSRGRSLSEREGVADQPAPPHRPGSSWASTSSRWAGSTRRSRRTARPSRSRFRLATGSTGSSGTGLRRQGTVRRGQGRVREGRWPYAPSRGFDWPYPLDRLSDECDRMKALAPTL